MFFSFYCLYFFVFIQPFCAKYISLTSYEKELFIQSFNQNKNKNKNPKPDFVSQRLQNIFSEFAINGSSINGSSTGFLLLETFDFLSQITISNKIKTKKEKVIHIQSLLLPLLGEQVSYEAEGNGELFQEIIPKKESSFLQTSVSSNVELEIHTEQAFSDLKPDIISLACIRGNKNAKTYIISIQTIIQHLTFQEIQMAKQSLWVSGIDSSFLLYNNNNHTTFIKNEIRGPLPILYYNVNNNNNNKRNYISNMFIQFDQDLYSGKTSKANQIMQKIIDIYYQYRMEIVLEAGQIVYIDNRQVLHGRSAFPTIFDGTERFLLRSFLMNVERYKESAKYRGEKESRMILAKYS